MTTPVELRDDLRAFGVVAPDATVLACLAQMLSGINPQAIIYPTHGAGRIKGAWYVMESLHGQVADILDKQGLQASEILSNLYETSGVVHPVNAGEVTPDALARIAVGWRMPSNVGRPRSQTEYARWYRAADTIKAQYPELFGAVQAAPTVPTQTSPTQTSPTKTSGLRLKPSHAIRTRPPDTEVSLKTPWYIWVGGLFALVAIGLTIWVGVKK